MKSGHRDGGHLGFWPDYTPGDHIDVRYDQKWILREILILLEVSYANFNGGKLKL